MLETSLGVVSACLPTLRPLYNVYNLQSMVNSLRNLLTRSGRTSSGNLSANSRRLNSSEGGSDEELRQNHDDYPKLRHNGHNGVGNGGNTYTYKVEDVPMEILNKPSDSILVKKDVSFGHEEV
jgi:hypothetical protein